MRSRTDSTDVRATVDRLLDESAAAGASDIHIDPAASGYTLRRRVDGLLGKPTTLDAETGRAIVTRLMVMAGLLTYRLDIPQEGRLTSSSPTLGKTLELRLAIMPTTHGLRAVVRLPAELIQPRTLDQLQLGDAALSALKDFAASDSGLLLLTGPAGSGKTTTIYALLDHIIATQPGLSLVALEDPVERDIPGVTQIEVAAHGELTYDRALRSMLRQDPQVLMLGEIRDAETARLAIAAALSGHRLIATLHAGSCATAIARLLEMDIEPYQLTSALRAVINQRLLRRRAGETYRGRLPIAACAIVDEALRQAVLNRADANTLSEQIENQPGHTTLQHAANKLIDRGLTDEAEVMRVLGMQTHHEEHEGTKDTK